MKESISFTLISIFNDAINTIIQTGIFSNDERVPSLHFWENFVFATLDFANFPYATLDFDISLLPLLVFDNYHNCHSRGKSKIFRVAIVIIVKS